MFRQKQVFGLFCEQAAIVLDFPAQKAAYAQSRREHVRSDGEYAYGVFFIHNTGPIARTNTRVFKRPIHRQHQNIDEKIRQYQ